MKKRTKIIIGVVAVIVLAGMFGSKSEEKEQEKDQTEEIAGITEGIAGIAGITEETYPMKNGKTLSIINTGEDIVIKAKIKSSLTNQMTIDQNYYNVCDYIRNNDLDGIEEVQYWAVADMLSGSESKAIAFTVPSSMFETIKGDFADNTLGDYVEDLWILPSLLE